MRPKYFTNRIEKIALEGRGRWRVWFTHYKHTKTFVTTDSEAIDAFRNPDAATGKGQYYKNREAAARALYRAGVAACGFCVCPSKGRDKGEDKQ